MAKFVTVVWSSVPLAYLLILFRHREILLKLRKNEFRMQGASLLGRRLSQDNAPENLLSYLKDVQAKDAAFRAEASLVLEKRALLPVYVSSLIDSYRPTAFYFEVLEGFRKLLLVGVLVFYRQGSPQQVRGFQSAHQNCSLPKVANRDSSLTQG